MWRAVDDRPHRFGEVIRGGAIVGLEGSEMCQAEGLKPGASGRTSSGRSNPEEDSRMSSARDGLWRTREAGG